MQYTYSANDDLDPMQEDEILDEGPISIELAIEQMLNRARQSGMPTHWCKNNVILFGATKTYLEFLLRTIQQLKSHQWISHLSLVKKTIHGVHTTESTPVRS